MEKEETMEEFSDIDYEKFKGLIPADRGHTCKCSCTEGAAAAAVHVVTIPK